MIVPGPTAKIYLAASATDMRKSFDGLYAMVLGVLKAENKRLLLRIQVLEKELYGSRSERRKVKEDDPNQNSFPGMEEAEGMAQDSSDQAQAAQPPARKRNLWTKTGVPKERKPLNPNLPRVEEFIADPDLKDLICPITGKAMHLIFINDVSVLARKPAEYYVRVLRRRVFGVSGGDSVVYSPWPADVMPRNRLDASVLGALICHRFADHQPYYRQSKQFERHGVQLARHTMTSLVALAERKLECIYDAIVKQTLASGYLMMDPTPVRLKSETRKGSTRMLDLNPEEYLIDVLARVDDHPLSRIEELTPVGWRESKNS